MTRTPFPVKKNEQTVTLPNGTEVPHFVFLERMVSGVGFEQEATMHMFNCLKDGGTWMLNLTKKEALKVSGKNQKKGGKGFGV